MHRLAVSLSAFALIIVMMVNIALFQRAWRAGQMSQRSYNRALKRLASDAHMPLSDLKLIAECLRELLDCASLGAGAASFATARRKGTPADV